MGSGFPEGLSGLTFGLPVLIFSLIIHARYFLKGPAQGLAKVCPVGLGGGQAEEEG